MRSTSIYLYLTQRVRHQFVTFRSVQAIIILPFLRSRTFFYQYKPLQFTLLRSRTFSISASCYNLPFWGQGHFLSVQAVTIYPFEVKDNFYQCKPLQFTLSKSRTFSISASHYNLPCLGQGHFLSVQAITIYCFEVKDIFYQYKLLQFTLLRSRTFSICISHYNIPFQGQGQTQYK